MDIDVTQYLGAVERAVETREMDGRPAHVIIVRRTYDTTVDDLWNAITDPGRIPRWFLPVSGDLRPGGSYRLEGNASGRILACEPPRRLDLTWEFDGKVSWVAVQLDEVEEARTRLVLEHAAHPDEHWEQFGAGAGGIGWDLALIGLTEHLRTGAAVDPAVAMAWMQSAAGLEYMRGSGEEWARASLASGMDQAEVNAAAKRTLAFYTGEPGAG